MPFVIPKMTDLHADDHALYRVLLLSDSVDTEDHDSLRHNTNDAVVRRDRLFDSDRSTADQCPNNTSHLACLIECCDNLINVQSGNTWRPFLELAMIAPRRTGYARTIAEMERFLRWQSCLLHKHGLSVSSAAISAVLSSGLQFLHFRYETLHTPAVLSAMELLFIFYSCLVLLARARVCHLIFGALHRPTLRQSVTLWSRHCWQAMQH